MKRSGSEIRSAKTNATTPPKLIPSCHSAAASGTLPTEQTKLMIATNGPMRAFSIRVWGPGAREKHGPPDAGRHRGRGEAGRDEADDDLAPQHRQVGDRVAGRVGPARGLPQPDR